MLTLSLVATPPARALYADAHSDLDRPNGVVVTDVPAPGMSVRFDEQGTSVSSQNGDVLAFSTVAWGRRGSMLPMERVFPVSLSCPPGVVCTASVEYSRVGITEWWRALDTGLEQGWRIVSSPPGTGALTIAVRVGHARGIANAAISDADGRPWMISGERAWDARGVALATRVTAAGDGLRIEVDDQEATFPIDIDPVYERSPQVVRNDATIGFGVDVSGVGDVDGDGYSDVLIDDATATGSAAYLYRGSPTGLVADPAPVLAVPTVYPPDIPFVGDVNHDGYDDVVLGGLQSGTIDTCPAYVYLGTATGLSMVPSATTTGIPELAGAYDYYDYCRAAGAGDVYGDGYDDALVGAGVYPDSDQDPSGVYVYRSGADGLVTTPSAIIDGAFWGSGVGDVNGDGYGDIAVREAGSQAADGYVDVYAGSAAGPPDTSDTVLHGAGPSFGWNLAGAGDVNGDGYDDMIVGEFSAYGYDLEAGRAYLYSGSAVGISVTPSTTIIGEGYSEYLGASVASAGDVDADGYADVVIGTATASAYLYRGSATGLGDSAADTLTMSDTYGGDGVLWGVPIDAVGAGAGDVDGDGYDDVLVGALYVEPMADYTSIGAVNLYRGEPADDPDTDGDGLRANDDCNDTDASIGGPSTRYLDQDGDGYGGTLSAVECPNAIGYVAVSGDCNDADPSIHPGATDIPDDGIDQDCDGSDMHQNGDSGGADSSPKSTQGCSGCATTTSDAGMFAALAFALVAAGRRMSRTAADPR